MTNIQFHIVARFVNYNTNASLSVGCDELGLIGVANVRVWMGWVLTSMVGMG